MYKTIVSCNSELHNMNWTTRKSMTHDYRSEQTVSHNDDIRLYVRSEGVSDTDTVCYELYTVETKQLWAKSMLQHRRATLSSQDSAVYVHLETIGQL